MAWFRVFQIDLKTRETEGFPLEENEVKEKYPGDAEEILSRDRHVFVAEGKRVRTSKHEYAPRP